MNSKLPVAVAYGEERVSFFSDSQRQPLVPKGLVAIRYVDSNDLSTELYPLNPNGSPAGIDGVQTPNCRVLTLMPHPERVVALESNSTDNLLGTWKGAGPWFRLSQKMV